MIDVFLFGGLFVLSLLVAAISMVRAAREAARRG